jgi:hypothetical protein
MFRSLAQLFATTSGQQRNDVFLVHPLQLSRWLDEAWAAAATVPSFDPKGEGKPPFLGSDQIVEVLDLPDPVPGGDGQAPVPSGIVRADPDVFDNRVFDFDQLENFETPGLIAEHLSYAYLIESTGVFEIMAEVVRRLVVGETLDTLSAAGAKWLRATEELFLREPPLFAISGVLSEVRPWHRVNRLNAYWRMFALEPPHAIPPRWAPPLGVDGPQPWKADTGGVNSDFREKWAELLRQIWLGIENQNNGIGSNPTDAEYVAFLAKALRDMLGMRRRGGLLAREEFVFVSIMSWFHLTLESDTPIVIDLKAEGTSAADRLAKIAQRVGMAPAARSRELFELSDLMSAFLRAIELGLYDTGETAQTLFLRFGTNDRIISDMNRIIDLWQSATGERVKDRPAGTVVRTASPQPVRLPSPSPTAVAAPAPVASAPPADPAAAAGVPAGVAGNGSSG